MIIDGRAIAADILAEARETVAGLPHAPVVRAVVAAPSAATASYLRIKSARAEDAGMSVQVVELPETATTEELIAAVQAPGTDAVLVQLPLPAHIELTRVLAAIPRALDADVLSAEAYAAFEANEPDALMPPVACAVAEICARSGVELAGKHALVVGAGRLVGQPVFHWLQSKGAHAVVVTRATQATLPALLPNMDVVVTGAGSPHLITPEHLKQGVVVLDAGTSESNGALVGDVDPRAAEVASVFTPIPGGVGPVAVACLFRNAALLARRALLTNPPTPVN